MLKKILPWVGLAFLIFFVVNDPDGAANVAESIFDGIVFVFKQIGRFFSNLAD